MNQMQSEKVKSSYILFVIYVALMSFLIGVQIGMWAQHKFQETVAMPSNMYYTDDYLPFFMDNSRHFRHNRIVVKDIVKSR